jgi:hypothetical protein
LLQARSISKGLLDGVLRPGLEGEVHSTFERACNLLCDGRLIGLVAPALGNGPDAIRVDLPPGGFAASLAWQRGTSFRLEGEQLVLPGGHGVNLGGAVIWDPEPVRPPGAGDLVAGTAALGRSLRVLGPPGAFHQQVLALWAGEPSPGGQLGMAFPSIAALREACRLGRPDLVLRAGARLVGLGIGLTPSGDDFLVGLTATLVRAARWEMASNSLKVMTETLTLLAADCRGRTTLPSEMALQSAGRGWLVEAASELVTSILGGVENSMDRLPELLALGHSSGADIASGIYMALRLLDEEGAPK